jgi:hypothetical protein
MWCAISRWMISRAEDTGKTLPRRVERHIGRCVACGAFARTSASLASRLRSERAAWLAAVPEFPVARALDPEAAGTGYRQSGSGRERSRGFRWALRPLPVAAAALILVAAGFVLFRGVRREPVTIARDPASARAAFERLASAPRDLRGALAKAQSPLDQERRALEMLVASAADYLGDRLNVRIERKGTSKDL